jgi:hypothetical protein
MSLDAFRSALDELSDTDPDDAAVAKLEQLVCQLRMPVRGPILIACARQVLTEDEVQPLGVDVLHGSDRLIADLLVAHGFGVTVRACVTSAYADEVFSLSRLSKSLPPAMVADDEALAPYVLDAVPLSQSVIRKRAATTLIHEAEEAHVYTLAALEVTKEKPRANPKSRPRMIVKKRPAKP